MHATVHGAEAQLSSGNVQQLLLPLDQLCDVVLLRRRVHQVADLLALRRQVAAHLSLQYSLPPVTDPRRRVLSSSQWFGMAGTAFRWRAGDYLAVRAARDHFHPPVEPVVLPQRGEATHAWVESIALWHRIAE